MSDESFPDDLLYTEDHEWARIETTNGTSVATVGITTFAVSQLGDVTQVDLPKEGETVKQRDVFGTVESVKAVSDLYAPFTGKVVKVNSPLVDSPEYLNEEPYDGGWMVQIELSNADEAKKLMSAEAYASFVRENEG